jgi:hypothetical protein
MRQAGLLSKRSLYVEICGRFSLNGVYMHVRTNQKVKLVANFS